MELLPSDASSRETFLYPKHWVEAQASGVKRHILFLIPGAGTDGAWMNHVAEEGLISTSITIYRLSYAEDIGLFRAVRGFNSRTRSANIANQINTILARHQNEDVSVSIACHSFATKLICEVISALRINIYLLLLMGAVCKRAEIERLIGALSPQTIFVNDCGTRDHVVISAGLLRWCRFEPLGYFGIRAYYIADRFFDYAHSDYVTADHFKKFVFPIIETGDIWNHRFVAHRFPYRLFGFIRGLLQVLFWGVTTSFAAWLGIFIRSYIK